MGGRVKYVVGVDGGGSGTRSVVASSSGRLMARGRAGPSNPLTVGFDEAVDAIVKAVKEASNSCGIERFDASCLSLAGVDRPSARDSLREKLPDLHLGKLSIISDAAAALAGATGCRPGVVVVAGTGSIVYGVNAEGETARAGGWGWMVGDEGSGYDIGRRAVTAALKAYDGRGPQTLLVEKVESELCLDDLEEVIDRIYTKKVSSLLIASLAPLVGEAADEGDTTAARILHEAGIELGQAASAVIQQLRLKGGFVVSPSGGVFNIKQVTDSFEEAARRAAPECIVAPPRFEPAVGSALLALKSLGIKMDDRLLMTVESSSRNLEAC